VFWEFLEFNTSMAPFVRTVFDGNDAANIMKLAVPGGEGAQIPVVSRDGSTVIWIAQAAMLELRTSSYASMAGGSTSTHGTLLKSGTNGLDFFSGHDPTPDGAQYVIAETSGAGRDLFVYNIDGTLSHQVTTTGQANGDANITPAISPDGLWVAYAYCDGGPCVIQTIHLDGTGPIVTHTDSGLGSVSWPTWSPDMTRIAYNRSDTGLPGQEPDNSNIYVQDLGVLPVELTAFTATTDGPNVHLAWQTASETNNAGFEVQMLADDQAEYEAVSFVGGHGTTTEEQNYAYTMLNVNPGTHSFRLKQIDFDGAFEYSPEVEATIEVVGTHQLSSAYPNPFNPTSQFTLAVATGQQVKAELFNTLGQRVAVLFDGRVEANQAQSVTIDGAGLASGMYVVRISGERFSDNLSVTLLK